MALKKRPFPAGGGKGWTGPSSRRKEGGSRVRDDGGYLGEMLPIGGRQKASWRDRQRLLCQGGISRDASGKSILKKKIIGGK